MSCYVCGCPVTFGIRLCQSCEDFARKRSEGMRSTFPVGPTTSFISDDELSTLVAGASAGAGAKSFFAPDVRRLVAELRDARSRLAKIHAICTTKTNQCAVDDLIDISALSTMEAP